LPKRERTGRKPRGRRPGDAAVTKAAILDAARAVFGERGYERSTIRAIAARAGVDPALVHHYFGRKHQLFGAAHQIPGDPISALSEILATSDPDHLGENIARFYVTTLFGPDGPLPSLLRAAATNEQAAAMLRGFVENAIISLFERVYPVPDIRLRIALVGSHLIGLFMARHVVGVRELAEADDETLVQVIGPVFQHYLTEPLGI
jgi:AcrR family transcriptional regulator